MQPLDVSDAVRPLYVSLGVKGLIAEVKLGKLEGKRPHGRPRLRWENNIKMDIQEVGCGVMDWIELAQDRDRWQVLATSVVNFGVPQIAGKFLTS